MGHNTGFTRSSALRSSSSITTSRWKLPVDTDRLWSGIVAWRVGSSTHTLIVTSIQSCAPSFETCTTLPPLQHKQQRLPCCVLNRHLKRAQLASAFWSQISSNMSLSTSLGRTVTLNRNHTCSPHLSKMKWFRAYATDGVAVCRACLYKTPTLEISRLVF